MRVEEVVGHIAKPALFSTKNYTLFVPNHIVKFLHLMILLVIEQMILMKISNKLIMKLRSDRMCYDDEINNNKTIRSKLSSFNLFFDCVSSCLFVISFRFLNYRNPFGKRRD
jgi:hypothetical protein